MPEPDRIIRLKTVLARTGLSRSTIYRKITEGTSPPRSGSASTALAKGNPTSIAGSPIPWHGVRAASMTDGETDNSGGASCSVYGVIPGLTILADTEPGQRSQTEGLDQLRAYASLR